MAVRGQRFIQWNVRSESSRHSINNKSLIMNRSTRKKASLIPKSLCDLHCNRERPVSKTNVKRIIGIDRILQTFSSFALMASRAFSFSMSSSVSFSDVDAFFAVAVDSTNVKPRSTSCFQSTSIRSMSWNRRFKNLRKIVPLNGNFCIKYDINDNDTVIHR